MKRITAIILVYVMTFLLVSCSKTNDAGWAEVISPVPKDGKPELTILISSEDYSRVSANGWLYKYIAKFKQDLGVDVKFDQINMTNYTQEEQAEYLKKLYVKIMAKDSPDLIFNHFVNLNALLEQQPVVDLRGKVANLEKIYDGLLSDKVYYAPLGVTYYGMVINRAELAELNITETGPNWTPEEFYAVRNKWISNNKILLSSYEYSWAFQEIFDYEKLYIPEEKKVLLNTPEVRKKINDLRNLVFGGTYQLIEGYKYENYYNMLFETESEEQKRDGEAWVNRDLSSNLENGVTANVLRVADLQEWIKEYDIIKNPRNRFEGEPLGSYGFLVNKNGEHLDLAFEFINGLLSNEVQLDMFKSESNYFSEYPVNKEIETDILELEAEKELDPRAFQIKAFALQELKDGKCILDSLQSNDMDILNNMIYKDLTKLILADSPYSDVQLQEELKRMEDKYNIYLNE